MEPLGKRHNENDLFRDPDLGPIEWVGEGMGVVDVAGEHVGTVEIVKMGDPDATTIGADQPGEGGLIQDLAEAVGYDQEPDLPPALHARLMRVGFIKIDGSGLTDPDYYVMADKIGEVSANTVRLLLRKENLLDEA
jgi:hypothetical protein